MPRDQHSDQAFEDHLKYLKNAKVDVVKLLVIFETWYMFFNQKILDEIQISLKLKDYVSVLFLY